MQPETASQGNDIAKRPANWASANADILLETKRNAPPIYTHMARRVIFFRRDETFAFSETFSEML